MAQWPLLRIPLFFFYTIITILLCLVAPFANAQFHQNPSHGTGGGDFGSGGIAPGAMPGGAGAVPPAAGGPNIGPAGASTMFTGGSDNLLYGVNLVPFGPEVGDHKVHPGFLTAGQTIDLYMYFPYYGGLYNYTTLSVNGYMAFATVLDQGPAF